MGSWFAKPTILKMAQLLTIHWPWPVFRDFFLRNLGGILGKNFFSEINEIRHLLGEINSILNQRKKFVRNLSTSRGNSVGLALFLHQNVNKMGVIRKYLF